MGHDQEYNYPSLEKSGGLVSGIVRLGAKVVNAIRNFMANIRARLTFTQNYRNQLSHQYDEKPQLAVSTQQSEEINQSIVSTMNEVFHGQHPGEYLSRLTPEEREQVIVSFAKKILKLYGLNDVSVVFAHDELSLCGAYSFKNKTLFINRSYLTLNDPVLLLDAVDTVIHESRHALQHAAMHDHNPLQFDEKTVASWVRNMNNYIQGSYRSC